MLYNWPKTGIVVPCYNEASRLPATDFIRFLDQFSEISFCFVNDGSSDKTQEVLEGLANDRTNQAAVIKLESNKGKAEAIRIGMKHILSWQSFEFVGYWDADAATPLSEIPRFIEVLKERSPTQFVCGSRIRRMGALIERFWYRHYLGRILATVASLILQMPVYDTQCGAKIIRVELARNIFNDPFLTRWFFDVELLARTKIILGEEKARQAIFEVPLENWQDKGDSKLSLLDCIRSPYHLLRIFWNYRATSTVACKYVRFTRK
jgi:dolichyl-phosphate beta-glucosyltransferase